MLKEGFGIELTFVRSLSPSWPAGRASARRRRTAGGTCTRMSGNKNPENNLNHFLVRI